MARVIKITMTGANLMVPPAPGWNTIYLDDGTHYVDWDDSGGFDGACDRADKRGHDTTAYRKQLDIWTMNVTRD